MKWRFEREENMTKRRSEYRGQREGVNSMAKGANEEKNGRK